MLTLNDGRSELWQWDTGRKLTVDADCSQVHFSNNVFGRSIDVDVSDGVAIIPDILLRTDKDLNVWAFVGTAESGYTKISKTFKVNRRNKPADYVFTPPEQTTLAELVGRLDKIEESQDPDAIKNAVEDYLERNPVESPVQSVNGKTGTVELTAEDVGAISNETDPTVPAWAKQPTKPTYTAAEVGAISQDNLQEAISEALAQAKKSGEFDGPQGPAGPAGADGAPGPVGATPNIQIGTVETLAAGSHATASMGGTPENPILNLGIPKGADGSGEGGSGIAVTGATVGQTVKIAAVDDDGVPTAWEPVDLPSGGKETWELISEGTITEEVTDVHITEDINGEPFELSKLYAYFKIEPCATVATNAQYATVLLNDRMTTPNKSANGDKTRYYQCVAVYVEYSVIVGQSMSNQPYNSAWSFDNHSPGNGSWINEGSIKKVTFTLGNGSAGPFVGVNSEYVLYGVRA